MGASQENRPNCLRCGATLVKSDAAADTVFFDCPECARGYALRADGNLTFRWGHPISLALYPVIFEEAPANVDPAGIDNLLETFAAGHLEEAIAEIRLELAEPTQAVGEMLGCRGPESELREYLQLFCERADRRRLAALRSR